MSCRASTYYWEASLQISNNGDITGERTAELGDEGIYSPDVIVMIIGSWKTNPDHLY